MIIGDSVSLRRRSPTDRMVWQYSAAILVSRRCAGRQPARLRQAQETSRTLRSKASRPRAVSRMKSPSLLHQVRLRQVLRSQRRTFSTASSPKFAASSRRFTPRVSRSPRKKLSSNAARRETAVRCKRRLQPRIVPGSPRRESHRVGVRRRRNQHRMRVHAKAEIGLPRPVLQVVPRLRIPRARSWKSRTAQCPPLPAAHTPRDKNPPIASSSGTKCA